MTRMEILPGRGGIGGVVVPLLLIAVFFGIQYGPFLPITEDTSIPEIYDSLEAIQTGSALRQVSIASLALLGLLGLFRGRRKEEGVGGWTGWPLLLFLFLAGISILWADDKGLTGRRLAAFAMAVVGSLGFTRYYDAEDLISLAILATGAYLLAGAAAEIFTGTFHPLQKEYRFSGLMHPNSQAMNCAVLSLASAVSASASSDGRRRGLLLGVCSAALLFLFLTKSRTSLVGTGLTLVAWRMLGASPRRKIALCLGCVWVACFVLLFLPDGAMLSFASGSVLPGRDAADIKTLTGRTDIWGACLSYIADRPLLGYGLGAFWTESRIMKFEEIAGWGASHGHSTYIDLALSLGIAGLALYVLMLAAGIRGSATLYKATRRPCYGFLYALFVYSALLGLLETAFPNPGLLTSLVLSGLMLLAFRPSPPDPGTG